jgi:plasmid stabilization system protein ParE
MSPRSSSTGRGSKAKYTAKQQRMAEHIEKGYEKRGTSKKKAEARAWATVNKVYGGGLKGGSGHTRQNKAPMKKGGTHGGKR